VYRVPLEAKGQTAVEVSGGVVGSVVDVDVVVASDDVVVASEEVVVASDVEVVEEADVSSSSFVSRYTARPVTSATSTTSAAMSHGYARRPPGGGPASAGEGGGLGSSGGAGGPAGTSDVGGPAGTSDVGGPPSSGVSGVGGVGAAIMAS
jgi:hypothetical protein